MKRLLGRSRALHAGVFAQGDAGCAGESYSHRETLAALGSAICTGKYHLRRETRKEAAKR